METNLEATDHHESNVEHPVEKLLEIEEIDSDDLSDSFENLSGSFGDLSGSFEDLSEIEREEKLDPVQVIVESPSKGNDILPASTCDSAKSATCPEEKVEKRDEATRVCRDDGSESSDDDSYIRKFFDEGPGRDVPKVKKSEPLSGKVEKRHEAIRVCPDSPNKSSDEELFIRNFFDEGPARDVPDVKKSDHFSDVETLEDLVKPQALKFRGISNGSNSCYANSILQALMHCPSFERILQHAISLDETVLNYSVLPMATSVVHLYAQIRRGSKTAVSRSYVRQILTSVDGKRFTMANQEDAEEFLGMLLNKLHDEEAAFTKKADISHVAELIRGNQQYLISLEDGKQIKSNSPFFCLSLDIEERGIKNVQTALERAVTSELKCFSYNDVGPSKVVKRMRVNKIIKISPKYLSDEAREKYGPLEKNFKIRSVVVHGGARCTSGHYTAYVLKGKVWSLLDDESVTEIDSKGPLKFRRNAMPYILFYELCSDDEILSDDDASESESEEMEEGKGPWCMKESSIKCKAYGPSRFGKSISPEEIYGGYLRGSDRFDEDSYDVNPYDMHRFGMRGYGIHGYDMPRLGMHPTYMHQLGKQGMRGMRGKRGKGNAYEGERMQTRSMTGKLKLPKTCRYNYDTDDD